jgi:hypothetical protein
MGDRRLFGSVSADRTRLDVSGNLLQQVCRTFAELRTV